MVGNSADKIVSLPLNNEASARESTEEKAHAEGLVACYKMRRHWHLGIGGLIIVSVFYQVAILVAVGLGELDFSKYEWLLQIVVGTNFASIIGLALIVVKFLFQDAKPR